MRLPLPHPLGPPRHPPALPRFSLPSRGRPGRTGMSKVPPRRGCARLLSPPRVTTMGPRGSNVVGIPVGRGGQGCMSTGGALRNQRRRGGDRGPRISRGGEVGPTPDLRLREVGTEGRRRARGDALRVLATRGVTRRRRETFVATARPSKPSGRLLLVAVPVTSPTGGGTTPLPAGSRCPRGRDGQKEPRTTVTRSRSAGVSGRTWRCLKGGAGFSPERGAPN